MIANIIIQIQVEALVQQDAAESDILSTISGCSDPRTLYKWFFQHFTKDQFLACFFWIRDRLDYDNCDTDTQNFIKGKYL